MVKGIQVKDEQGNQIVHTNAADIHGASSSYWGEVYSKKAFDSDKAAKSLVLYVMQQSHLFDFEELTLPDEEHLFETIMRVKDAAAGPDGVSYSAYKACPLLSSEVLVNCVSDLASEQLCL